jgi:hypothetical protein
MSNKHRRNNDNPTVTVLIVGAIVGAMLGGVLALILVGDAGSAGRWASVGAILGCVLGGILNAWQ